jgi:alpha-tubulin suppressor-like RCC1 family protein
MCSRGLTDSLPVSLLWDCAAAALAYLCSRLLPSLCSSGAVSCGARHSLALTDNGCLFSFGWGTYGQLGLGNLHSQTVPTPVVFSPPSRSKHTVVVTAMCAGFRHW